MGSIRCPQGLTLLKWLRQPPDRIQGSESSGPQARPSVEGAGGMDQEGEVSQGLRNRKVPE